MRQAATAGAVGFATGVIITTLVLGLEDALGVFTASSEVLAILTGIVASAYRPSDPASVVGLPDAQLGDDAGLKAARNRRLSQSPSRGRRTTVNPRIPKGRWTPRWSSQRSNAQAALNTGESPVPSKSCRTRSSSSEPAKLSKRRRFRFLTPRRPEKAPTQMHVGLHP